MREQETSPQQQSITVPAQVWNSLSPSQQKLVLQTIVRICQDLVSQWSQEAKNESKD